MKLTAKDKIEATMWFWDWMIARTELRIPSKTAIPLTKDFHRGRLIILRNVHTPIKSGTRVDVEIEVV